MSRRDGKLCGNCRFYDEEEAECHHSPPTVVKLDDEEIMTPPNQWGSRWPCAAERDWCGRWEPEAPNRRRDREARDTVGDLA